MSGKIPVGPYRQRNAIDQGMERPHEQDLTDCDQDAGRKKVGKEKEPAKQTWPKDDELEALLGSLRRSTEVHGSTHDELAIEQKHRCADVEGVERRADRRQDPQGTLSAKASAHSSIPTHVVCNAECIANET